MNSERYRYDNYFEADVQKKITLFSKNSLFLGKSSVSRGKMPISRGKLAFFEHRRAFYEANLAISPRENPRN